MNACADFELLLPTKRRSELSRYRCLRRVLGLRVAGKLMALMYRMRVLHGAVKTYYVLSTNPPIIYLGNVMRNVFEIAELMKDRPVTFIKNAYYTYEKPERITQLKLEFDLFQSEYPQHDIHFVCATPRELELFEEAGIAPATYMNKNAFVDEHLFTIQPQVEKKFDAIYNAQIYPVKRHPLAARIPKLALLGYLDPRLLDEVSEYAESVRTSLSNATWLNDVKKPIPPRDVPRAISQARVGLCLSNEEGPMAASLEYLLCGLPVVSTVSLGGRDVFFDPDYTLIVKDDPVDVARGVSELIARNLDPAIIRLRTLEAMASHRKCFVDLVQSYIDPVNSGLDFGSEFRRIMINKLRASAPFPGAFFAHLSSGMPVELCRRLTESSIV